MSEGEGWLLDGVVYYLRDAVSIYWSDDRSWYRGRIAMLHDTRGIKVSYNDGEDGWLGWHEIKNEGRKLIKVLGRVPNKFPPPPTNRHATLSNLEISKEILQVQEGDKVQVFWEKDDRWFNGEVSRKHGKHGLYVSYEDGDKGWVKWRELSARGSSILRLLPKSSYALAALKRDPSPKAVSSAASVTSYPTSGPRGPGRPPRPGPGGPPSLPPKSTHKGRKPKYFFEGGVCGIDGCTYSPAYPYLIQRHQENVHGGQTPSAKRGLSRSKSAPDSTEGDEALSPGLSDGFHYCQESGCTYRARTRFDVKRHATHVHGIVKVWHVCSVDGCGFRAKMAAGLGRHTNSQHRKCSVAGCGFRAKMPAGLARHTLAQHGK